MNLEEAWNFPRSQLKTHLREGFPCSEKLLNQSTEPCIREVWKIIPEIFLDK